MHVFTSVCLFVYLFVCLFVCLFVYLFPALFVCRQDISKRTCSTDFHES